MGAASNGFKILLFAERSKTGYSEGLEAPRRDDLSKFRYHTLLVPWLLFAASNLPAFCRGHEESLPGSQEAQENLLLSGSVSNIRTLAQGVTGSKRVTVSSGKLSHDAHVQTVDIYKKLHRGTKGVHFNFRDSYRHNIAAYRLDKMLDLGMVPVSVERRWRGKQASFTWWVEGVAFSEGERLRRGIDPPDAENWNWQVFVQRVFDQLIYNADRNPENLLITDGWRMWLIDHTRAFLRDKSLSQPEVLSRCDRQLLARLKKMDRKGLDRELGPYLRKSQLAGLLARRDRVLQIFAEEIVRRGEESVLYDYLPGPGQLTGSR